MADDISLVVGVDYSEMTGLIKTTDQTKRVLGSVAKEFSKTGNHKNYMRGINQIVSAQKNLDKSARMSRSEIMKLGSQMMQEAKFTNSLASATQRLGAELHQTKNKMNGSNVAVQQLGYQVGDFAVQVQGGTSAFVAFSQQGAQLAGMLPLLAGPLGLTMGAAVGLSAALGILIPIGSAVGRMFFEMRDSTKSAAEDAEDLDKKLKSLSDTLEDYADTLEAIDAGVSLDELFASRGVAGAEKELAKAKATLDDIKKTSDTTVLFDEAIRDFLPFVESAGEAYEKALNDVIAAETRLALLREKEADKRASNFASSSLSMKQELELLQAQAKFGADSAQASNAELEQELRNRKSAIDARVEAGELDAEAAASLKLQAERSAELGRQIQANTAEQKRFTSAIKLFYDLQQGAVDKQKELKDATDDITKAVEAETKILKEKLALNEIGLQYGETSKEYQDLLTEQQRNQFKELQKSNGILGNNLDKVMAIYDANVLVEDSLRRQNKIKFSNLDMSDAMLAIAYEEYGLSRANAPKEPPKPKKTRTTAKKKDPLAELRKRITLEERLIGKTEAQRQIMQALGVDYEKVYGKSATDDLETRINKIKELQKEEDKLSGIAENIGSSFESAFTSMVDGTSSVKDAFRDMARDIVAHLFKVLVMQQMINSIGGALSGSSNSIVSSIGGALESYDGGGYTGSGPRSGGMDGRGGRLAVIHPQETVIDHTKANSGVGEQVVINQSFNFQANGDDSVKKLIAEAAPQIANLTQKQIVDSRKRGGTMKSAFG